MFVHSFGAPLPPPNPAKWCIPLEFLLKDLKQNCEHSAKTANKHSQNCRNQEKGVFRRGLFQSVAPFLAVALRVLNALLGPYHLGIFSSWAWHWLLQQPPLLKPPLPPGVQRRSFKTGVLGGMCFLFASGKEKEQTQGTLAWIAFSETPVPNTPRPRKRSVTKGLCTRCQAHVARHVPFHFQTPKGDPQERDPMHSHTRPNKCRCSEDLLGTLFRAMEFLLFRARGTRRNQMTTRRWHLDSLDSTQVGRVLGKVLKPCETSRDAYQDTIIRHR